MTAYVASDTKRRRSTRAEVERFRDEVHDLVERAQPCSVRHVYYLAVTAGLIPKDEGGDRNGYTKVMRAIGDMRERGELPFEWIVDHTRLRRGPAQWSSAAEALEAWTQAYRRDLWRRQAYYLEVWCESDSIAGVLYDVTESLGVDLMAIRGQSSKTFAWSAAQAWDGADRDVVVLYVGDFDPAGAVIGDSLEERLFRYAEDVEMEGLDFERLAVTPGQVRDLGLIGHGLNPKAPGVAAFRRTCDLYGLPQEAVEAEAIDPNAMRGLLRTAIEGYIDPHQWEAELAIEQAERESLDSLRRRL